MSRHRSTQRLDPRSFTSTSITVLEQSDVEVAIETNHPLKDVKLEIGPKMTRLEPVDVAKAEQRDHWTFSVPSNKNLFWKFSGSGYDGTPMEPVSGRLRIRRDGTPRISWQDPVDAIKAHTLAELPMDVRVADDYGLSECGIVFELGGEDYVLTSWPPADEPESDPSGKEDVTTRVQLQEILPLESFALSERDFISYYAYAIDNREGNPQRIESDIRYIDIRPLRQFYSEIELDPANGGGGGGGLVVQLEEIIRRQRFLMNRTRRLLNASSEELAKQLGAIDRMVKSQSELAGLVRLLSEFLVARGNDDVEALNQAEVAMLQAADSLSAGSIDLAYVQEGDAVRALAEARQSLELALIKNPTPQQLAAFRRFSRQLRQKLRRDRPKTEQQLADSLKRIASEQARLGKMADRLANAQQSGNTQQPQGSDVKNSGNVSAVAASQSLSENGNATITPSPTEKDEPAKPKDESQGDQDESKDSSDEDDSNESQPESSDDADSQGSESNENAPTSDDVYAKQIDLLERLRAIEDDLSQRLDESPLFAKRMESVKSLMDGLAGNAKSDDLVRFAGETTETVDQINEMSVHLKALAATNVANRINSLRDMTGSLSNLEESVARNLTKTMIQRNEPLMVDEDLDRFARRGRRLADRSKTVADVLQIPVEVGDVEAAELQMRLDEFIEENEFLDTLSGSETAGDDLDDQNKTKTWKEDDLKSVSGASFQRATDYAVAAQVLDELYQQVVTPRLNRLRRLERRANQLNRRLANQQRQNGQSGQNRQQNQNNQPNNNRNGSSSRNQQSQNQQNQNRMGSGNRQQEDRENQARAGGSRQDETERQRMGGSGGNQENDEYEQRMAAGRNQPNTMDRESQRTAGEREENDEFSELEIAMAARVLRQELEAANLKELSELLAEDETSEREIRERLQREFGDQFPAGGGPNGMGARLTLIVRQLQRQIQEMILLEISADRDGPVPAEYRRAVDNYFSTIATDASGAEFETAEAESK